MEQLDILIFAAHPDDAEIGMGGTIVKHAKAGFRVGICDLTLAELSSNGTPEIRQQEALLAGERLGLTARINLRLPDRGLRSEEQQIRALVRVIRACRPRIIFAPYWIDRHPDHVACSHLVEEAVFNAKLRRYTAAEGEAHDAELVYFYFIHHLPQAPQAQLVVDISETHNIKMAAIKAYRSQFEHSDETSDPASLTVPTPLNQGYLDQVVFRDRLLGQQNRMTFAEGFACKTPLRPAYLL